MELLHNFAPYYTIVLRDELPLILGLCTAILSTVGSHDLATAQQPQQQQPQQRDVTLQQRQSGAGPLAATQRPMERGDQMLLVRPLSKKEGDGQ